MAKVSKDDPFPQLGRPGLDRRFKAPDEIASDELADREPIEVKRSPAWEDLCEPDPAVPTAGNAHNDGAEVRQCGPEQVREAKSAFDKVAYQKDYMRRKRAEKREAKRKAEDGSD